MTVQEIEQVYLEGLKKIQAPPPPKLEPVIFGEEETHFEYLFVTTENGKYKYGNYSRGNPKNIRYSEDYDEVLYYIFEFATHVVASYNLKKCNILLGTSKFEYRRLLWKIQLDLLLIINPQYAQRCEKECEAYIAKSPFDDGLSETLTFLDGYPCPILSPNIPPGICPLDDEGGPCIFLKPIE